MIGPHTYKHLDKDDKFQVNIELQDVVAQIMTMNYGVQRFLSHLVDARRKEHADRILDYLNRGQKDIARNITLEGDKLAEGIDKLLKSGLY